MSRGIVRVAGGCDRSRGMEGVYRSVVSAGNFVDSESTLSRSFSVVFNLGTSQSSLFRVASLDNPSFQNIILKFRAGFP